MSARTLATTLIKRHEGLRLHAYDDATGQPIVAGSKLVGHPTIGYGRHIAARGISEIEAEVLLHADVVMAEQAAQEFAGKIWPWLGEQRQAVLMSMAHQMGAKGLLDFKQMRTALARAEFNEAANQMLLSLWARQTPSRAKELAEMMRTGNGLATRAKPP